MQCTSGIEAIFLGGKLFFFSFGEQSSYKILMKDPNAVSGCHGQTSDRNNLVCTYAV